MENSIRQARLPKDAFNKPLEEVIGPYALGRYRNRLSKKQERELEKVVGKSDEKRGDIYGMAEEAKPEPIKELKIRESDRSLLSVLNSIISDDKINELVRAVNKLNK